MFYNNILKMRCYLLLTYYWQVYFSIYLNVKNIKQAMKKNKPDKNNIERNQLDKYNREENKSDENKI